jgi:hypothetical protein
MSVSESIFMKLMLGRQLFVKTLIPTEFYKNPTNSDSIIDGQAGVVFT